MFRHLLVPLDGSRYAEQALPVAARLAQASQGTITLVQIIDSRHTTSSPNPQEVAEDHAEVCKNYLEQVLQRPYLSQLVTRTEVASGDPSSTITTLAARLPIDLVVLASHGYTGVRRWFLGSVAEHLARFAPVPVLVLHDQKPLHIHHRIDGTRFIRALVPLDGLPGSMAAVLPATHLVGAFCTPSVGEVHLAHVVVSSAAESISDLEIRLQNSRKKLDTLGLSLYERLKTKSESDRPPLLTWAVTLEMDIARGIVRRAEHGEKHAETQPARACDVIVMTTRGSTDRPDLAERSITEQVLHATHLPVLVVHPAENKRETEAQKVSIADGVGR